MRDFPKQYKQIKADTIEQKKQKETPFFFFPEQYKNMFDIQQLFRLFVLDSLHVILYENSLSSWYFVPDPLFYDKKNNSIDISFLKKQLKQFWLPSLVSGLQTYQDLAFVFSLQSFFADYFRKWNFYEDRFLVYRSPKHQTPVSSDLVNHITTKKNRYTIKYFVSTKNHSLDVITDSPETIFGDVAIAIHPQYKKAKQLKWQEAIIPIINKTIPIIIDERADFTRFGGIYRVTPWHDKLWLAIAKDHNLPIDKYAIDKDWFFAEDAGLFSKKPVEGFFTNIIQSLSDIWNLTKTESFSGSMPVYQSNWENLIFRSWKWLFVKIPDEEIDWFFSQEEIKNTLINREIINNSYRLASSHQKFWIPVPLWKNDNWIFVVDSKRLENSFKNSREKQWLAFWLFILHCISSKLIPVNFSAEEFVTMIFDIDQKDLNNLFTIISKDFPNTKKEFETLNNVIQSLDKEKSIEKNVSHLLDILDNSFCLEKGQHEKYQFAFAKFDPSMKNIEHYWQVINYDFLTTFMLLQKTERLDISNNITFSTTKSLLKTAIKNILFAQYHLNKSFIESIYIIPSIKNEKDSIELPAADLELAKNYHHDCIRIWFLSLADWEIIYKSDEIFTQRDQSIAKFWNACRYIKTTLFKWKEKIDIKKIQKDLEKNIESFSAFDSRILWKLTIIVEEYQQIKTNKNIWSFVRNLFDFINQDFSSKYLELIKSAQSEYSKNISLCIIKEIISFLKPYIPTITNQLSEIFWFDEINENNLFLKSFENIQKNYSISLFMEIIDKFNVIKDSLWLKKHDIVDIFIRSNPDFLKFAKSNESLFKKTLNAQNVLYLVHHEETPCWYKQEDIIDISIWLKAISKPGISGINLLQKQLQEKEEYLQHLKHIVQQLSSNWSDTEIINSKKDEISKIKKEIEIINFEISKCKMKE